MLRDRPAWPRLNQRAVVVRFMVCCGSNNTRSPRVSSALLTTLFAAEVPLRTK